MTRGICHGAPPGIWNKAWAGVTRKTVFRRNGSRPYREISYQRIKAWRGGQGRLAVTQEFETGQYFSMVHFSLAQATRAWTPMTSVILRRLASKRAWSIVASYQYSAWRIPVKTGLWCS